jgi:hypothetical protein
MLGSPLVLRTPGISIECTIFERLCTGLSRHRRLGLLCLRHFC